MSIKQFCVKNEEKPILKQNMKLLLGHLLVQPLFAVSTVCLQFNPEIGSLLLREEVDKNPRSNAH